MRSSCMRLDWLLRIWFRKSDLLLNLQTRTIDIKHLLPHLRSTQNREMQQNSSSKLLEYNKKIKLAHN